MSGRSNYTWPVPVPKKWRTFLSTDMEAAFPDAMVSLDVYQEMIGDMPNDEKDRHVLAAAIATQADVLVTANLKDFKPLPDDCEVEIQHPDDFLHAVLVSSSGEVFNTLKDLASRRHEPINSILNALHKAAPNFVMEAFDILPRYQSSRDG